MRRETKHSRLRVVQRLAPVYVREHARGTEEMFVLAHVARPTRGIFSVIVMWLALGKSFAAWEFHPVSGDHAHRLMPDRRIGGTAIMGGWFL